MFSNTQVGNPAQFDALLKQRSANTSTRNIVCTPVTTRTTIGGVTTTTRNVNFSLGRRQSTASTQLATVGVRDQVRGNEIVDNVDGFSFFVPETFTDYPVLNEATSHFGNCKQAKGGYETKYIVGDITTMEIVSRPTQYEFFITNPFPATWTAEQCANAIGGCLWAIVNGITLQFAVTPERVVSSIRRSDKTITSPEALSQATKIVRVFRNNPEDCLQNIFPRLEVVDGKLVNTSIINSKSWVGQKNIKSSSGQTLTWSWVVGLFNDTESDGPWSTQMGPAILDIKRSDWEFIPFDDCTEFTLVDSEKEKARIDVANKTIYFSSKRRTVFSLQLRQQGTDKGEDYNGYTNYPNAVCSEAFYSDSLPWFLVNTYNKK